MKYKYFFFLILIFPTIVLAKPEVILSQKQEKEITVEENGKMITRRVEANDIMPGEKIFYTISYRNNGNDAAKSVKIKNVFADGVTYVSGSASTDPVTPLFSIDDGKTFSEPGRLTYEKKDEKNNKEILPAGPESYTHIQWVLPEVQPKQSGEVTFQVSVD